MKYYFINSEGDEFSFDLNAFEKTKEIQKFKITIQDRDTHEYYVKVLAGKFYLSEDKKSWSKLPRISSQAQLVEINETFQVYSGFKPSGLSGANEGELVTDMPGKVVKVMAQVGDQVKAGDTLMILEAMKMENEIKAGIEGEVKAVHVSEGQTIDSGHLMLEISSED